MNDSRQPNLMCIFRLHIRNRPKLSVLHTKVYLAWTWLAQWSIAIGRRGPVSLLIMLSTLGVITLLHQPPRKTEVQK